MLSFQRSSCFCQWPAGGCSKDVASVDTPSWKHERGFWTVAYAENFHGGGFWFRVIWLLFGVHCLWRHNLMSVLCFQTNALAKCV